MRTQTTPYTDQRKKTSSPFNAFVRDRILNLPREQMIGLPGDLTLHEVTGIPLGSAKQESVKTKGLRQT